MSCSSASLFIDNGTNVFTVVSLGDIAGNHTVDDLHIFDHFTILDDLETGTLDNQIILILVKQVLGPDFSKKESKLF